jgi:hypothetical protein
LAGCISLEEEEGIIRLVKCSSCHVDGLREEGEETCLEEDRMGEQDDNWTSQSTKRQKETSCMIRNAKVSWGFEVEVPKSRVGSSFMCKRSHCLALNATLDL